MPRRAAAIGSRGLFSKISVKISRTISVDCALQNNRGKAARRAKFHGRKGRSGTF